MLREITTTEKKRFIIVTSIVTVSSLLRPQKLRHELQRSQKPSGLFPETIFLLWELRTIQQQQWRKRNAERCFQPKNASIGDFPRAIPLQREPRQVSRRTKEVLVHFYIKSGLLSVFNYLSVFSCLPFFARVIVFCCIMGSFRMWWTNAEGHEFIPAFHFHSISSGHVDAFSCNRPIIIHKWNDVIYWTILFGNVFSFLMWLISFILSNRMVLFF